MNTADISATLIITNPGTLGVGISNLLIPAAGSRTLSMAGMGPAYKADVWLSTYAASLAGLVSTVPATAPLDDAWSSAHHYRPLPILHTSHGGQSSAAVDQGGQRAVNGGQGENMPAYGSSPTGVQLDFTLAQNSQYIPLLVFI